MIEEAIVSILAAAKIGAVQTIVFSGYSYESLKTRLQDCHAKILITSDGFHRNCLLYTSPSPRDRTRSRMPSSA